MKSRLVIISCFAVMLAAIGVVAVVRAVTARQKIAPAVIHPAVVRCAALRVQPYAVTESFHGLIQANIRVDLAFQIPGRISQLGPTKDQLLKENDAVEAGQVLALLEPMRYQAAVDQAHAQMEEAKAQLSGGQAIVADAQARLDDARREFDRIKQLQAAGAVNPREVEKAETAVKLAEASLDGARAKLASATASYESGRAAATMANVNLQDATLKAPMRALVAAVPTQVGQMITPAQPVVTLVDMSKVKLVVGVVERKLPLLKKGQKVRVEVQALKSQAASSTEAQASARPREGLITIVPPAAEPVTGLFNVEIELPNADGSLRPGMVGKAVVTVAEKKAVAIPAEAVGRSGEEYWAFFVGAGYAAGLDLGSVGKANLTVATPVARKVTFKPLAIDKDYYLVADLGQDLAELIVEGQTRLVEGQPVQIVGGNATAEVETRE